jgi:toxin HigB-1
MLHSFADRDTEEVWFGLPVKRFGPDIRRIARRKLTMLNAAAGLNDCRVPPGNRLEKLSGDRAGQYSIRINDQFRICFRWTSGGPEDVEIVDYH